MNTSTATFIFRCLRAAEITLVLVCLILEIIEYASFLEFYTDQGFPTSAYFSARITKSTKNESVYFNGTKIFYYIVLILSFIDSGFYVTRGRLRGPFKRDISISAFFMTLYIVSAIANIYPAFEGYAFTCDGLPPNAIARECNSKVLSISFGWINGFLFFLTTLLALKLWKGRQEKYEGERRVEALREVVYKYKPRPNTIAQVDEPEQVMIFKTFSKSERKKGTPTYVIRTSHIYN